MIKIVTKSDLAGLESLNLPEVMKKYLREYHEVMLKRLDCPGDSLEKFGCIFVLDSEKAVAASKLGDFLQKNPPARIVGMTLFDGETPVFITQILLFVQGGYAVSIFAKDEHVKGTLEDLQKRKEETSV